MPADTVKRVVPELIAKGRYDHPWLGFSAYEINEELAAVLDLPMSNQPITTRDQMTIYLESNRRVGAP